MLNTAEMELLIIATALLAVAALTLSLLSLVKQQRVLSSINVRIQQMCTDLSTVRIGRAQQWVEKCSQSQQKEPAMIEAQGYAPYSQATRLFDSGAKLEEVVSQCGISRAEAELMGLMHRQMKRRGPRAF